MRKRVFSVLLALVLCIGFLPAAASAEQHTDTDVAYPVEGGSLWFRPETGEIVECEKTVTEAVIPAEIDGTPVTGIWKDAFTFCNRLTSVTIPESVTSFYEGPAGVSDEFPVFHDCRYLESITVSPDNPAFASLDGVLFSRDMATLIRCPAAKSGDYTIPDGVTAIGSCAFYGRSDIAGVTIPESVISIGNRAFYNCGKFVSAEIPDSVTHIGSFAFYGCESLAAVTIPDGVTEIGEGTFSRCSAVTSITIPDGVTSIGASAFSACAGLTEVTIPDSVTEIGNAAFAQCSALASVTIPDGVTHIGADAFSRCAALTEIKLPNGVTSVERTTFYGCSALASVTIPKGVACVDDYAFTECGSLTDVYYGGTEAEWEQIEFRSGNDPILNAAIHFTEPVDPGPVDPGPVDPGPQPAVNPFADVPDGTWFTDAVLWAVEHEITNGTGEAAFSPDRGCTRGQVATFLWRAYGSPSFSLGMNPFTDVEEEQYYYAPVLWAVENGVTNGLSPDSFGPDKTCTRGQVVTFLWRAAGSPEPESDENPFTDVKENDYFYKPVLWAVENGITNGTSDTSFSPGNTCTRAHVVTFLYRSRSAADGAAHWKKAYLDLIAEKEAQAESLGIRLVFIDGDDVPEMFVRVGQNAVYEQLLCTFDGSAVVAHPYGKPDFNSQIEWIEGSGLFWEYDSDGKVSFDTIYSLSGGQFETVASGYNQFDPETISRRFFWNEEEITEEEYQRAFEAVFDTDQAVMHFGAYQGGVLLENDAALRFLKAEFYMRPTANA